MFTRTTPKPRDLRPETAALIALMEATIARLDLLGETALKLAVAEDIKRDRPS